MGIAAAAMGLLEIGKGVVGAQSARSQASVQESAVKNQMAQQRMAAEQQSIERNKQLREALGMASAQAAARGISTASGSFKAINDESIQKGILADRIGSLNLSFKEQALRGKLDEIQKVERASIFSSILGSGSGIMSQFNLSGGEGGKTGTTGTTGGSIR